VYTHRGLEVGYAIQSYQVKSHCDDDDDALHNSRENEERAMESPSVVTLSIRV